MQKPPMLYSNKTFDMSRADSEFISMLQWIDLQKSLGYVVVCEQITPFMSGSFFHLNYFVRMELRNDHPVA